jgi:hypothetical protein
VVWLASLIDNSASATHDRDAIPVALKERRPQTRSYLTNARSKIRAQASCTMPR